jgi:hypothetical protein
MHYLAHLGTSHLHKTEAVFSSRIFCFGDHRVTVKLDYTIDLEDM